ncbi:dephospho-CoA kinase [Phaeovibrio sulfidiphilus]|uniref:Dephospho-CoA kinase n=1 Tax=Phaeovibrio sulfidiphilus TaxID=1220600 RepID=A0A8J6YVP8_9PROT|nr:dephospho-CoA kinase [Phaeovibrio sulfidiphilus]MBE1236597.1 dephospho-CoA kinase [Phaeovibrio sulfidiphilus]
MTRVPVKAGLARRQRRVRVLGLTGSIGMGKSTVSRMAKRLRIPVHDADRAVHDLLGPGGKAVAPVLAAFPGVGDSLSGINRKELGQRVFGHPDRLRALERILHPLVHECERAFLARAGRARHRVVLLDIPLLFETGGEARCDSVCVVRAPGFLRAIRVLSRQGMTPERLRAILARQATEETRRVNADSLISSGLGYRYALRGFLQALDRIQSGPVRRFGQGSYRPHA